MILNRIFLDERLTSV